MFLRGHGKNQTRNKSGGCTWPWNSRKTGKSNADDSWKCTAKWTYEYRTDEHSNLELWQWIRNRKISFRQGKNPDRDEVSRFPKTLVVAWIKLSFLPILAFSHRCLRIVHKLGWRGYVNGKQYVAWISSQNIKAFFTEYFVSNYQPVTMRFAGSWLGCQWAKNHGCFTSAVCSCTCKYCLVYVIYSLCSGGLILHLSSKPFSCSYSSCRKQWYGFGPERPAVCTCFSCITDILMWIHR